MYIKYTYIIVYKYTKYTKWVYILSARNVELNKRAYASFYMKYMYDNPFALLLLLIFILLLFLASDFFFNI